MIAYIMSYRFTNEEIAFLLRVSLRTIEIYIANAVRQYNYGGTFFENANTIKKQMNIENRNHL